MLTAISETLTFASVNAYCLVYGGLALFHAMLTAISETLTFASVNAYCLVYGGLALFHALAAGLSWRHRHVDHATVYACCSSLYGWLSILNVGAGH